MMVMSTTTDTVGETVALIPDCNACSPAASHSHAVGPAAPRGGDSLPVDPILSGANSCGCMDSSVAAPTASSSSPAPGVLAVDGWLYRLPTARDVEAHTARHPVAHEDGIGGRWLWFRPPCDPGFITLSVGDDGKVESWGDGHLLWRWVIDWDGRMRCRPATADGMVFKCTI